MGLLGDQVKERGWLLGRREKDTVQNNGIEGGFLTLFLGSMLFVFVGFGFGFWFLKINNLINFCRKE